MIINNMKRKQLEKSQLNQKGHRLTPQRLAILRYLHGVTCHPTAETVYKNVKQTIPHISLATIYRNLKYLALEGYILQFHDEDDKVHYDGNPTDHIHFICQKCNEIFDIFSPININSPELKKIGTPKITICKIFGTCNKCK